MVSLKDLAVVNLDVHIWSGRHKLRPEDLDLAHSQIPPHELATLGSKRSISRKALNPLESDKRTAERLLHAYGVRFLNGRAVPLARLPEVRERLDEIEHQFNAHRAALLARYDAEIEAHIAANHKYERAIRAVVVPATVVARRISFTYQVFQVGELDGATRDGLAQAANGLSSQLFAEVAENARAFYERSLHGKDTFQARSLIHLMRLGEKLASLAFLDHRIAPVVREIATVLKGIPTDATTLTGTTLVSLRGLVALLSDPDRMLAHGEGVIRQRLALPTDCNGEEDSTERERPLEGVRAPVETEPRPAGLFY